MNTLLFCVFSRFQPKRSSDLNSASCFHHFGRSSAPKSYHCVIMFECCIIRHSYFRDEHDFAKPYFRDEGDYNI